MKDHVEQRRVDEIDEAEEAEALSVRQSVELLRRRRRQTWVPMSMSMELSLSSVQ